MPETEEPLFRERARVPEDAERLVHELVGKILDLSARLGDKTRQMNEWRERYFVSRRENVDLTNALAERR